jgi:S-DNA-T family DNA segregation ATPase FtsK/SpoIIIE
MAKKRKGTSLARSTANRKKNGKKNQQIIDEALLLGMLAVCILLFLSCIGRMGIVGKNVCTVLFGLFGVTAFLFPISLFVGTAFMISNKANSIAALKVVSGVLFYVFFCLFAQLVCGDYTDPSTLADCYRYGAATHLGGGVIGGGLEVLIRPYVGLIATFVIDLAGLIITLVLVTERSLVGSVKNGSRRVYDSAREDMTRHKQRREENRKERQKETKEAYCPRSERKVSGVSMNTNLIEAAAKENHSDEITEVHIDEKPKAVPKQKGYFANTKVEEVLPQQEKEISMPCAETASKTEAMPQSNSEPEKEEHPALRIHKPHSSVSFEDEMHEVEQSALQKIQEQPVKKAYSQPEEIHPAKQEQAEIQEQPEQHEKEMQPKRLVDEVQKEAQSIDEQSQETKRRVYQFPPTTLLAPGSGKSQGDSDEHLRKTAQKLEQTLKNFGVNVTITDVSCGPSVTRYELQPEQGVKVSKIVGLTDDIKLNLAAADIRMEAPIPGKAAIGIEVPNKENVTVPFRDLVESKEFISHQSPIAFAAGKDIAGNAIIADIAKMPHLLIAGATGSGKSVCINTIIMSILYRAHPDDVKLIMIDPKVVELSVYNGIPHLFIPVVTDPKKAAGALHWAVSEMTNRYNLFAKYQVRDLKGYNDKVAAIADIDDPDKPQKLPRIVIIVDELADLMMVAPGDVEDAICRLAQLARACGIHLIIATQRPSVNVITGLIKANMPSRIAFSVSSGVDSRTILDMNGAEKLLGKGDMLYYPQGLAKPLRVQGAFVSDEEVSNVVNFLREQGHEANYDDAVVEEIETAQVAQSASSTEKNYNDRDELFEDAARFVIEKEKGSIGMLQRMFRVGFNRAARIMDQLEEAGIVGPEEGTKPRKVLVTMEQFEHKDDEPSDEVPEEQVSNT